jgi:hypothetical protein
VHILTLIHTLLAAAALGIYKVFGSKQAYIGTATALWIMLMFIWLASLVQMFVKASPKRGAGLPTNLDSSVRTRDDEEASLASLGSLNNRLIS